MCQPEAPARLLAEPHDNWVDGLAGANSWPLAAEDLSAPTHTLYMHLDTGRWLDSAGRWHLAAREQLAGGPMAAPTLAFAYGPLAPTTRQMTLNMPMCQVAGPLNGNQLHNNGSRHSTLCPLSCREHVCFQSTTRSYHWNYARRHALVGGMLVPLCEQLAR